jgi:phage terminase large subunit-like protein
MPWQQQVAEVAGELDPDTGRMAYEMVVVTVPRQSGKTTLVRSMAMQRCATPDARVWYTAQTRNDARDAWMDAVSLVTRSPLKAGVQVRLTNGSESLTVKSTGGTFRVFAPLPDALHGRQGDLVVIDEAWSLSAERGREMQQAILPTMATRARPQILVLSTAGTDESEFLKDLVRRGRQAVADGRRSGIAYFEWATPEEISPTDLDGVCAAHPAVGHTISRAAIEAAAEVMADKPGEFMRAYANQWTSAVEVVIDPKAWNERRSESRIAPDSTLAFGMDATPDRGYASVVVAGRDVDGAPVIEPVAHGEGVAWLTEWVKARHAKWPHALFVADGVGPVASVVDALAVDGIEVRTTSSREYATACTQLYDAVHETRELHVYQGEENLTQALDDAALAAGKRGLGESWAWSRKGSAPISPLIAATLALWALGRPEEPEPFIVS